MKKLFSKIFDKQSIIITSKATQPKGFIDFETGKRVDIDETTHKEVVVGA